MGCKRYKIADFEEECHAKGFLIPVRFMREIADELLKGNTDIYVPQYVFYEMEKDKEERDQWEKNYNEISTHRLNGMALEKEDIEGAIAEYRECIEIGEAIPSMLHAYAHAYERIIILLHKVKDIDNEIKYINQYLHHDLSLKEKEKYQMRLNKLITL